METSLSMKRCTSNWKNANEYPPFGCEDRQWLAWEFLRRNKKYAEHYEAISQLKPGEFDSGIAPDSDSLLSVTECVPPAMDGETAVAYCERMRREGVKRWRISKPKILFTERWMLAKPVAPDKNYSSKAVRFVEHQVKIAYPTCGQRDSFKLTLAPNEVMVRFRLDLNIAPQLISALARLNNVVKDYDKRLNDGQTKLRRTRKDSVVKSAHVWLRCYDAYQVRRQYVDDPKRKRKRTDGPVAIVEQFRSEDAPDGDLRAKANRLNPPDWYKRAVDYIDGKLYQKLLFTVPSEKEVHALQELLRVWRGQGRDD